MKYCNQPDTHTCNQSGITAMANLTYIHSQWMMLGAVCSYKWNRSGDFFSIKCKQIKSKMIPSLSVELKVAMTGLTPLRGQLPDLLSYKAEVAGVRAVSIVLSTSLHTVSQTSPIQPATASVDVNLFHKAVKALYFRFNIIYSFHSNFLSV